MASILAKLRSKLKGDPSVRIQRRKKLAATLWNNLALVQAALLVTGLVWMVAIPYPELGQRTYIDENALQPGQVNTYWNWGDVGKADQYLAELEALRDRNASSVERAEYFVTEFAKLGLPTETQAYSFNTVTEVLNGTNAYAVLSSPRASGTEAIIISAPWKSLTGAYNLRGISTVLALSNFLKGYSHWSKNLVFVISDGHLDGMQAWLSAYHGEEQSNLVTDSLTLPHGVVWTALNLDYHGHSFSHLGVFREGVNGRLPNQDLINSLRVIAHNFGVPVVLYDHIDPSEFPGRRQLQDLLPSWIPPTVLDNPVALEYVYRARNIWRQFTYQARGIPSGAHGLFHQHRIDAITLYAVPSNGPHGFHALGRVVESTMRTMNNLLERLHASFFFYIMANPGQFLKIGMYLPSAILVGASLMFGGLGSWVQAGWYEQWVEKPGGAKRWTKRSRDLLPAARLVALSHVLGLVLYFAVSRLYVGGSFSRAIFKWIMAPIVTLPGLRVAHEVMNVEPIGTPRTYLLLKAITLCLASTLISVTSLLNFSLAALLAVTLGIPLTLAGPSSSPLLSLIKYAIYLVPSLGWLYFSDAVKDALWHWEVLGVWFAPFIPIIYTPLMLQAGMLCMFPSGAPSTML
ncbi:Gaa1-domain-containing protein [Peniophora sp. CONT]|nr:Gaa1-domain-containing protein [Peniophora sp. CONT]